MGSKSRSRSTSVEKMDAAGEVTNGKVAKANGRSSRSGSRSVSRSVSRSRSRSKSKSRSASRTSRSRSRSVHEKSRSKSKSASKSKSRSRSKSKSKSRSRSRSRSNRRKAARRSRSKDRKKRSSRSGSPSSKRMNPSPCRVLGIFGLSLQTDDRDIKRAFEKYGRLDKVKLVTDPRTSKSRGFAFIYFNKVNDAQEAKENLHGHELDGHHIRVEYSISNREHNPTPGVYMGRSYRNDSYRDRGGRYRDNDRYGYGGRRRGGSRRSRSRTRSRSRSYERRRRSYSRD